MSDLNKIDSSKVARLLNFKTSRVFEFGLIIIGEGRWAEIDFCFGHSESFPYEKWTLGNSTLARFPYILIYTESNPYYGESY